MTEPIAAIAGGLISQPDLRDGSAQSGRDLGPKSRINFTPTTLFPRIVHRAAAGTSSTSLRRGQALGRIRLRPCPV